MNSSALDKIRQAFDSDDAPTKNLALRLAFDAIDAMQEKCGRLENLNNSLALALEDERARIEALTAENFKLAAGSCDVEGGKVGDEHGHFYCTLQAKVEAQAAEISKWHTVSRAYLDRIETLRAEIERLNKSAECLADSRRLAVKDVAELEAENERLREALQFYAALEARGLEIREKGQ
jgi:FtsZ-binding cell division protein ZapB